MAETAKEPDPAVALTVTTPPAASVARIAHLLQLGAPLPPADPPVPRPVPAATSAPGQRMLQRAAMAFAEPSGQTVYVALCWPPVARADTL